MGLMQPADACPSYGKDEVGIGLETGPSELWLKSPEQMT